MNKETIVGIAAKLYQARRVCRDCMGDSYAKVIGSYIKTIRQVSAAKQVDTTEATTDCIKKATHDGDTMGAIKFMAAYVEIVEPSNPSDQRAGVSPAPSESRC